MHCHATCKTHNCWQNHAPTTCLPNGQDLQSSERNPESLTFEQILNITIIFIIQFNRKLHGVISFICFFPARNSTYVKIDFYVQSLGPLNEMEMVKNKYSFTWIKLLQKTWCPLTNSTILEKILNFQPALRFFKINKYIGACIWVVY